MKRDERAVRKWEWLERYEGCLFAVPTVGEALSASEEP